MKQFWTLTRRNIKLFYNEKTSVFYSLLGALIALLIVLIFLRASTIDDIFTGYSEALSKTTIANLLDLWIVGGSCAIAAATTALGGMRVFVADRETGRWRDFLVSPISSAGLVAAYLFAMFVTAAVTTTIVFGLGIIYATLQGATLGFSDCVLAWLALMLCVLVWSAIMGFISSFVARMATFMGIGIVTGALFGFLAGVYVQFSALPATVANVLSALPFAQGPALVNSFLMRSQIAELPANLQSHATNDWSITMSVGSFDVSSSLIITIFILLFIVFAILTWLNISKKVSRI